MLHIYNGMLNGGEAEKEQRANIMFILFFRFGSPSFLF